jgi:cell division protein YceG involved in septum cleavage
VQQRSIRWVGLGIGIGLVLTGILSGLFEREIPEHVIIQRAAAMGMVFRDEVVAFSPGDGKGETVVFCLPPGMSDSQVAAALIQSGVIDNAVNFRQELEGQSGVNRIQAGVYRFGSGEDPAAVIRKIISGEVIARFE